MEWLLHLLPSRHQPLPVKYGVTAAVTGFAFAVQHAVWLLSGDTAFFILLPAVFFAGLAFDKGSGILSVTLAAIFIGLQRYGELDRGALSVVLFFLIGIGIAFVSETMRKALEQAWAAEKAKGLLLEELAHRTKNNLAMVSSLLRLQARHRPDLQDAFCGAANRVQVMASVHDFLRMRKGGEIDVGQYITELCQKLGDTLRGVRPIAVIVEAEHVELPAERAVPIGIIVNELVTNSLKYAFPEDRNGIIEVGIRNEDTDVVVRVADNGVGCVKEPRGVGSTLVQLMANQLHGSIEREDASPGCRVVLRLRREHAEL